MTVPVPASMPVCVCVCLCVSHGLGVFVCVTSPHATHAMISWICCTHIPWHHCNATSIKLLCLAHVVWPKRQLPPSFLAVVGSVFCKLVGGEHQAGECTDLWTRGEGNSLATGSHEWAGRSKGVDAAAEGKGLNDPSPGT